MNENYTIHNYLNDSGIEDIPKNLPAFPLAYKPMPHQVSGLNKALYHTRFGLYDDPGTGKSYTMQAYALNMIALGNKVVCVMPPVLCEQFIETTHEFFKGSENWFSHAVINKIPTARQKQFDKWDQEKSWPDVLLMSYQMFSILNTHIVKIQLAKRVKKKKVFNFFLRDKGYNVLICDEAQALKGAESTIHSLVYRYTEDENETALILATGTPLHHTPLDGFAMCRLTDRETQYKSMENFKRIHCIRSKFKINKLIRGRNRAILVEDIKGYKDLELLNQNMYRYARRVEKDQVLSLKDPTLIPVDFNLEPAHRKLYTTMANERMIELGENRIITSKEATQLREHLMRIVCCPNEYTDKKIKNNVLESVDQLIDSLSLGPSNKLLLYCHHNMVIETLADHLSEHSPLLVYGGKLSSQPKNAKSVDEFKTNPDRHIMISHPLSGGVGLNLQNVCSVIIFVEPTSIAGDFNQSLSRIHRAGQKHAVVVYLLRPRATAYVKMVEFMLTNSDLAMTINQDTKSFRQFINGED